ncbi:MFS transporter [Fulvivirgaceae bacterium BMA10]|uniref:MFS transporter n=1 Tax=Splendidivirga corallicola TaxID=3051826 RepID=A0ABT8KIN2_9BACT|nr:MFS transporter [Fulvivirgaceae bacterium BMA10]
MNAFSKTAKLYKDSYSGHPREVWVLAALTLINRMGTMVLPFLTVYLTTVLNFPLKQAGMIVGAFGFGSLIGSYLGGRFSDRFGANLVIINSLLISGFMLISLQFAKDFYSLFGLIFITAAFGEAYRPAVSTAVGNYVDQSKTGRTMALLRLAINLGMSASPAIGGFVAASLGYDWLFWIDGLTCMTAAVYFIFASRSWKEKELSMDEVPSLEGEISVVQPQKNGLYLLFLLSTFIMGFAFIQWFHSVPVFIKSEWGFDERYIGILMATNSLIITLIEMPVIHAIEAARKIRISVLAGLALIAMSFLPFLLPKMLILCFVATLLLTMGEILYFPFNNSIALNMSPMSKRGEYMSWYWMSWSLAHILAPTIGLAFIDRFGFSEFWVFIAFFACLGLFINWKISDKIKY